MKSFAFDVPATSANLGPGFDAIGAALELRLRAEMRPSASFKIRFEPGRHAPTHDGYENEILRGMRALASVLPPVELVVSNAIPLGRGLGSSAAALVLGLLAADTAYNLRTPQGQIIERAASLEGHPDNTTPALVGGIVVSVPQDPASDSKARFDAIQTPAYLRIQPPKNIRSVIAIPDFSLSTEFSRGVLPDAYSKADSIFNVRRAALLAASLATGNLTQLRVAMQDRMHQPYRARLIPGLEEALALNIPGLLGVALSGAGPTILAFAEDSATAQVRKALHDVFRHHEIACETVCLDFASEGARVISTGIPVRETAFQE